MSKFDKLYEETIKEFDESIFNPLKKVEINWLVHAIEYYIRTRSHLSHEQLDFLKEFNLNLKKYPKYLKKMLVILQKHSKLSLVEKDIFISINLMLNNKIDMYQIKKDNRDEKAMEFISKQIERVSAT